MASDSRRRRSWWTLLLIPLALAFYPSTRSLQADDTKQLPIEDHALCSSTPTGTIETTLCDYESVDTANDKLVLNLKELVQTPFFRYFRIDLYRECPFWHDNGLCMSRDCAITSVDESEIPEKWRAATLSKLEPPSDQRITLPGCYYRDSDFCFLDDHTEGDYFDLSLVPERYTGYSGPSANRVWKSIYEENCFGLSELDLSSREAAVSLVGVPDTIGGSDGVKRREGEDAICLEKRVYYKIISGLHASISTHICYEHLNQSTGTWGPSLSCFVSRVASHPERLQAIYFDAVLLLRAVSRIGPYLRAFDYCSTGTHEEDVETHTKVGRLLDVANEVGRFNERGMFRGIGAEALKDEFKAHFRNVSRIMDCVGCDKCRLWGKVQVTGIATALKVLFELDEKALDPHTNPNLLQRSEVIALIQTLYRFSESLSMYGEFRALWKDAGHANGNLSGQTWDEWRAMPTRWIQEAEGVMRDGWQRVSQIFAASGKEQSPLREEL